MKLSTHRQAGHTRERGVATVAIAFLLLLFMGLAVLGAATLSTGTTRDAAEEHARVNALFLAESGIERAIFRYNSGTVACGNGTTDGLAETVSVTGRGTVTISSINTNFSGTALSSNCRIRARATATGNSTADQVVRTIETIVIQNTSSSSTNTKGNRKFSCTINAGTNRGLVVGLSWTTEKAADITASGVPTFNGASMTQIGTTVTTTDNSSRYRTALFYLALADSLTAGTYDGALTFTDDLDNQNNTRGIVFGCMPFNGVTAPTFFGSCAAPVTAPTVIDARQSRTENATVATGTSSPVSVSMTPNPNCVGNRYMVASAVRNNSGNLTKSPNNASTTDVYNSGSNADTGAFETYGPVTASTGAVNLGWTWNQNKAWAAAGLIIYATGLQTSAAGGKAAVNNPVSGGGTAGVTVLDGWREIIVPPP